MIAAVADIGGWQATAVIVKAAAYGATLAAAGGVLFLLFFHAHLREDEKQRIARLVLWLAAVGIIATLARIAVIAGTLGGAFASLWDWPLIRIVLATGEGPSSMTRVLGLLMIGATIRAHGWRCYGAALGALLVCLSFALVGHAGAIEPKPIPQVLLAFHVLAVAYWIGALWPLRMITHAPDLPRVAAIMKRFGAIALYVVGGLIVAGSVLLWLLVREPSALIDTAYGRLVLIKLGLVAILLTLAAVNKLRLTPRLVRGDTAGLIDLRRSITAETVVAALILTVTATFTTLTGAPALN